MTESEDTIAALAADGDDIDRLVAGRDPGDWARPTPAAGWTVAHQIAHLAATFRMAALAASDPDRFSAMAAGLSGDFDENVRRAMAPFLAEPPDVLFARWRAERANAVGALARVPEGQLVPWLVNPLPGPILARAGMMEMFGHGQDIADALGVQRPHTDRIRHIVGFAVRTRDFGYLARGLTPPEAEFRFELTGPSGDVWCFGPDDATERVSGPAVDFCLLVTRRRHPGDLAIVTEGPVAAQWLNIAQAYRGPAGSGRAKGQFAQAGRAAG
jgi:uncharacterized protein (TIGR03084 family)